MPAAISGHSEAFLAKVVYNKKWKRLNMTHTITDLGLMGYKNWRKSITLLPVNTQMTFTDDYNSSCSKRHNIQANQLLVITKIEVREIAGDSLYTFKIAKGKRSFVWSAEGIHRMIIDDAITVKSVM